MTSLKVGALIGLLTVFVLAVLYYLRALTDRPLSETIVLPSPAALGLLVLSGGDVGSFGVIVCFYVVIGLVIGWLARSLRARGESSGLIASTIICALTLPPALVDSGSLAFGPWIVGGSLATAMVTFAAAATVRVRSDRSESGRST